MESIGRMEKPWRERGGGGGSAGGGGEVGKARQDKEDSVHYMVGSFG